MKFLQKAFLLVWVALTVSACASTSLTGEVVDNVNMDDFESFYVVRLEADQRGVETLIADALQARGFVAAAGEVGNAPEGVDALVIYRDRWQWDFTMYMIELTIEFRDADDEVILAYGNSFRTSLAREKPEFMINEVLDEIFN